MNNQLNHYINIEPDFFQELEGEFGVKITGQLANFLRTVEIVRPNRFMTSEMKWCGIGRKKLDREKFFRAFLLKAEFNLPTTNFADSLSCPHRSGTRQLGNERQLRCKSRSR